MIEVKRLSVRFLAGCSVAVLLSAGAAQAQQAPIVQPGAPGQASRTLEARDAARVSDNRYSDDDVAFMQGMIPHHQQAVEMANLVADRTNTPEIVDLAGRIRASQDDEIAFMRNWLTERGEAVPAAADPHAGHGAGHDAHAGHSTMAGMATPEQMAALAASSGSDFDRMFLDLMIRHHAGAITMVERLLARPGSAYEPELFQFVNDINSEQQAEIRIMDAALRNLWEDPRSTLRGGFLDAEQAALNMTLVASLPKPEGFYDPTNPPGMQHGHDGHLAVVNLFMSAFPDMRWEIEDLLADGD